MKKDIFEKFDFLKETADQALYFYRNEEDSFEFDFFTFKGDVQLNLTKNEVSFLLPTGSEWSKIVGWRSIFCIPLIKSDLKYFALGVEKIVPHATRGAYPISHIFFFQDIVKLYKALRKLNNHIFIEETPNDLECRYNGIIKVDSPNLKSFEFCEKFILKCAEKKYSLNDPILFRTAILIDNHLDQIKNFDFRNFDPVGNSKTVSIYRDKYLIGIPKKIEGTLSFKSKMKILTIDEIPSS